MVVNYENKRLSKDRRVPVLWTSAMAVDG